MVSDSIDKALDAVDRIAGVALALVTGLVFVSVSLRYLINWPLPDTFDFTRYLLGIAVFWGIASATASGELIKIDLLWTLLGRRGRILVNAFARVATLGVFGLLLWQFSESVIDEFGNHHVTNDLLLPVWPFYAIAWIALPVAVATPVLIIFGFTRRNRDKDTAELR